MRSLHLNIAKDVKRQPPDHRISQFVGTTNHVPSKSTKQIHYLCTGKTALSTLHYMFYWIPKFFIGNIQISVARGKDNDD